jgi:serine/threonine protein phosphatase PrpC
MKNTGTLSVTRAFGNLELAKYVQPDPHITEIVCTQADTHLILACDGVLHSLENPFTGLGLGCNR